MNCSNDVIWRPPLLLLVVAVASVARLKNRVFILGFTVRLRAASFPVVHMVLRLPGLCAHADDDADDDDAVVRDSDVFGKQEDEGS